ncbi:MAG TPA: TetR/AcrR family transcriptional regulator [Polyangiaceae bacterium]|nr:TetR/AcrR family transcriptional regulator [Polyangiaceae bacterium]
MRSVSGKGQKKTGPRRGRPPGSTSDQTRRRILQAACECFGARGYESTTNRDIADRAGLTAAAIYQYFDSKLVLYTEAAREAQREIVPLFEQAIAGQPSARAALSALTRAYATAYERFPRSTPFLSGIAVEMHRHPEVAGVVLGEPNPVLQMIVDIVERGVDEGEIPRGEASAVVSMYLASTMGFSLQAALTGAAGLAEAVEAFVRLLDGNLFAAPREKAKPAGRKTKKAG